MKDIRFFLQEFGIRNPDVKVAPMIAMNSDKEMYTYLIVKLDKIKKETDASGSISTKEKYEFLASFMKSCVLKGGFPPEISEFRRKTAKLPSSQREKDFNRTLALVSKW